MPSVNPTIEAAREYLAAYPLTDLTTMPRPVLERYAAEYRRHLAAVLDAAASCGAPSAAQS